MNASTDYSEKFWRETPLIKSDRLSSRLGCDVYLKLEVRVYVRIRNENMF